MAVVCVKERLDTQQKDGGLGAGEMPWRLRALAAPWRGPGWVPITYMAAHSHLQPQLQEDTMPPSGLCGHSTHMVHIHEGKILTQKVKISKSFLKMGKWILQGPHTYAHRLLEKFNPHRQSLMCLNLQGNVVKNSHAVGLHVAHSDCKH